MKIKNSKPWLARIMAPVALGAASLLFQALLFRQHLAAFAGNEISLGFFFAAWLLALALGGWLGERVFRFKPSGFWLLALIPAALAQWVLLTNARAFAGLPAYEPFPPIQLAWLSLAFNLPVPLVSGWLFVGLVRRAAARPGGGYSVNRVYVPEVLGGFVGGLLATLLLARGLGDERLFVWGFAGVLILTAGARIMEAPGWGRRFAGLLLLAGLILPWTGQDQTWRAQNDRRAWTRQFPGEGYQGEFLTQQGRYLFGALSGQRQVLAWEAVCESWPDRAAASEAVAAQLAQSPGATRVLIIGFGGLSEADRLLDVPQVQDVVWLTPDPEYGPRLLDLFLPGARNSRLRAPAQTPEQYLRSKIGRFDLALLRLPPAQTLAQNHYFTRDFILLVKSRLASDGVLGVALAGGENFIGPELAQLGGSLLATLQSVFRHVAIQPGETAWLFASDAPRLSQSPEELRRRFSKIPGATNILDPDRVLALYPQARAETQLAVYRRAAGPARINTDQQPFFFRYSLLALLRQLAPAGNFSAGLDFLAAHGFLLALGGLLLVLVCRRLQMAEAGGRGEWSLPAWDARALIFSIGWAGLALNIAVLFLFQARLGTLFVYQGLLAAVFMLGLFAGSAVMEHRLTRRPGEARFWLAVALPILAAATAYSAWLPPDWPARAYALWLAFAGAASGMLLPPVARELARHDHAPGVARDVLWFDNAGGALGGLLASLLLVPALGLERALLLPAALLMIQWPALLLPGRVAGQRVRARWLGVEYALLALALFAILVWATQRWPAAGLEIVLLLGTTLGLLATVAIFIPRWLPDLRRLALAAAVLGLLGLGGRLGPEEETPPPAVVTPAVVSNAPSQPAAIQSEPSHLPGRTRPITLEKIRGQIRDGQLSGHEAMYYEKLAPAATNAAGRP